MPWHPEPDPMCRSSALMFSADLTMSTRMKHENAGVSIAYNGNAFVWTASESAYATQWLAAIKFRCR